MKCGCCWLMFLVRALQILHLFLFNTFVKFNPDVNARSVVAFVLIQGVAYEVLQRSKR